MDAALREGLSRLAVPLASPAFDDRVLASLAMPEQAAKGSAVLWASALRESVRAWWNGPSLQLMLSGAACAVIFTLGAYALSIRAPVVGPNVTPSGAGVAAAASPEFLDPEGSSAGETSYRGLLLGVPRAIPVPPEPQRGKPELRRGSREKGRGTTGAASAPRRAKGNGREA